DELSGVGVARAEGEVADHDGEHSGGQCGDHHEDHQLDQRGQGPGVEPAHRIDTFAPRAMGPTRSTPRSGTSPAGSPSDGPSRPFSTSASAGLPAYPAPEVYPYDGGTRSVPLPVGSSMPSLKFGWWRTGLDWLHGGLGRCRQLGPRLS